jgi:hypothetical protein
MKDSVQSSTWMRRMMNSVQVCVCMYVYVSVFVCVKPFILRLYMCVFSYLYAWKVAHGCQE